MLVLDLSSNIFFWLSNLPWGATNTTCVSSIFFILSTVLIIGSALKSIPAPPPKGLSSILPLTSSLKSLGFQVFTSSTRFSKALDNKPYLM